MPSWLLYTLGVAIFAIGLLASIALHEVGHMVPAKKFGVKVTQYMVGFGPTVWSRHRGDTEYGVKAIPLGGYIRMIGMVPPRADGTVSRWPRRMATAIEDFRQVSRAEVQPGDGPREFYRLTPGKKMIVMLGGPTMNFLIYIVLTFMILTLIGKPHDDATRTVATISKCVVPATAPAAQQTDCAVPNSPAVKAGLLPGDTIVAMNGVKIANWDQAVAIIEAAPNKTIALTVDRNGTPRTLQITPVENLKYTGVGTQTKRAGFIGVASRDHHYYTPVAVTAVPGQIASQIGQGAAALGHFPAKVVSLWRTVFEGQKRDPAGAVGVVGIGRLSGDFASSKAFDLQDKIVLLLSLLASVNLLLFFFNLLPLLPLDGGHVAGAMVEAAKRGRARLHDRRIRRHGGVVPPRKPIFVDTAQMLPVMYAVGSVLILLTVLTLYADIVKPISLNGG